MTKDKGPETLLEAVNYFSDLDVAASFVARLRWPNGPQCPRCGSHERSYLSTRRLWKCKGCKKQYSVKVGTIFEDSPLGLNKWLPAVWLIANSKNGVSSHELGRALGVTQKSAWFMLHRIRLAMQTGTFRKLDGEVEVDESFIGGAGVNMHAKRKRERAIRGGQLEHRTAVLGMRKRGGEIRAMVVPDIKRGTLLPHVMEHVEPGSTVYTDRLPSDSTLGWRHGYDHQTIDHAKSYVEGQVHTNGIENFWSLFKRSLKGTYVSVAPGHVFRYLDERLLAYNLRDLNDLGRFKAVLAAVTGRSLTWAELVGV